MWLINLLLVPLAVFASAIPHGENSEFSSQSLQNVEKRQLGEILNGLGAKLPNQKTFKTETDFQPSIKRDGVKRLRLWYGPYKIKALNVNW
jgi:hypothetical protein